MQRTLLLAMLCAACVASLPSRGEEAVVTIGKQRASASAVEWEVRDVDHPRLGPIRFASRKAAVATPAGGETVVSQAYVSCQKSTRKIAIELSNAFASNPAGGLGPRVWPQLTCYSPDPRVAGNLAISELSPKWEVNNLGDALVQGLAASELRRCVSIDVLQDIALPAGGTQGSLQVVMELLTYSKALDAVFAACGEKTAYAGPAGAAPAAAPPAAAAAAADWRRARTIEKGRTNVRAAPSTDSPLAVTLAPGMPLLAQRVSTDWWKVKPRSGSGFGGYIRGDRLVFE
jgi:hypothetical protein